MDASAAAIAPPRVLLIGIDGADLKIIDRLIAAGKLPTFARLGNLESSIGAYEKSVALKPTALACKTLAALSFEVRRDSERATVLWKQSLELDRISRTSGIPATIWRTGPGP